MKKMLLAVRHEYLNNIRQNGFLIALFSLPLFIGLSAGLGLIMSSQEKKTDPVGYVDYSGVFAYPIDFQKYSESSSIEFIHFENENVAHESLRDEKIQAYFIIRSVARMFRAQVLLSGQPFSLARYIKTLAKSQ